MTKTHIPHSQITKNSVVKNKSLRVSPLMIQFRNKISEHLKTILLLDYERQSTTIHGVVSRGLDNIKVINQLPDNVHQNAKLRESATTEKNLL